MRPAVWCVLLLLCWGAFSVKISSFNIFSGKNIDKKYSLREQGQFLSQHNLDFIGLQEVDNNTVRSNRDDQIKILSQFAKTSYYKYFHLVNYSEGQYGIGIMSKYPIIESFMMKFRQSSLLEQRGLVGIRTKVENQLYWVLNTHFSHVDETTQFNAAVQTVNKLKELKRNFPNDLVLLTGDLNVNPGSRVVQHLATEFHDTWTKCGSGNGNTFDSRNPTRRIDYILSSKQLGSCIANVPSTVISDHRPIILTSTQN